MIAPRDPTRSDDILGVEPALEDLLAENPLKLDLGGQVGDDAGLRLSARDADEVAGEESAVYDGDGVFRYFEAGAGGEEDLELAGVELGVRRSVTGRQRRHGERTHRSEGDPETLSFGLCFRSLFVGPTALQRGRGDRGQRMGN